MAYVAITGGIVPASAPEYVGTVVDSNDWASVPTGTAFLDFSTNTVLYKDANGYIYPAKTSKEDTETNIYLTSSTQWSVSLPSPVPLADGNTANGFTFFDNATDKVAEGTTSYDEYNIAFGLSASMTGTSGTADLVIAGTTYTMTFATDLATTISNFVTANDTALRAADVRPYAISNASGNFLRLCSTDTILNAVTVTTTSGNLAGTMVNEFVGGSVAVGDHCVIPYGNHPYDGQRLLHTMRVNFDISTGNQVQSAALTLRRYADDSVIGTSIRVSRDPDVPGNQFVFETYTNGATDPFVTGGFYFALENNSGATLTFESKAGILVQTIFQRPTSFSS
jgi:hypothetical protein